MKTMNNFFASKNFELSTRMPTPPRDDPKGGKDKGSALANKKPVPTPKVAND